MRKVFDTMIAMLVISYPFAIYFSLHALEPRYVAMGIALVFALRFITLKHSTAVPAGLLALTRLIPTIITLTGAVTALTVIISNKLIAMQFYPFIINLFLFSIFFYSLWREPTIIEIVARLRTPELPIQAIQYTRKVTIVWCVFFMVNGMLALWTTLFTSIKIWTLYNGFIAYIVIGLIFSIEFIIRQRVELN